MSGQVALFSPLFDLTSSGWPVLSSRISVWLSRMALKTPLIALKHPFLIWEVDLQYS
ncbi:hypothetical protein FIBSPDRAFT_970266 [Athelia psychrophila]|uniref:Uncharacterized protein n=1 Tax=Athelia psychrophila TaxID=1759441 RepID=A0A167ST77_9AGAM|nr:hypothetical protein FIBSPDRAFT_970266 [Fibularhizoctonia sp. CBS 109695]